MNSFLRTLVKKKKGLEMVYRNAVFDVKSLMYQTPVVEFRALLIQEYYQRIQIMPNRMSIILSTGNGVQ